MTLIPFPVFPAHSITNLEALSGIIYDPYFAVLLWVSDP